MAEQRTDEWFSDRRGRLTASRFGDVLARRGSLRWTRYRVEVAEGLISVPDFEQDVDRPWFRHGKQFEEEGLRFYEFSTGFQLERVGLIKHPALPFIAASPDGLLDEDAGVELKVHRSIKEFMKVVETQRVPARYIPQVQGNMLVTGRSEWQFLSYLRLPYGKSKMNIIYVRKDEVYHQRLLKACCEFYADACELAKNIY